MNIYAASNNPRVADVVAAASRITMISQDDIMGPSRKMHITRVRHAVSYVAHGFGHPYNAIGRVLGGRDHSTVINAVDQAEELLKAQSAFRMVLKDIEVMSHKIANVRRRELLGEQL